MEQGLINYQDLANKYFELNPNTQLTRSERENFIQLCMAYHLNPFTKQIYTYKFGPTPTIVVSYDVILSIGQEQPNFSGYDIKYYSGNEEVVFFNEFTKDLIAIVTIYQNLNGNRIPFTTTRVNLCEYRAQMKSVFAKNYFTSWVEKIALTNAFRRSYSKQLKGLYIVDELGGKEDSEMDKLKHYQEENNLSNEDMKAMVKCYLEASSKTMKDIQSGNFKASEVLSYGKVTKDIERDS